MIKYVALLVLIGLLAISFSNFAGPNNMPSKTYEERKVAIDKLKSEFATKFKEVKTISAKDALKKSGDKNIIFVDIREDKERAVSRIHNSVSKTEFQTNIEKYKNKTVVAYCTIGYRSSEFIESLPKDMQNHSYNLEGSILSWINEGGKLVDSKGLETKKVHVYGKKWNVVPPNYQAITD